MKFIGNYFGKKEEVVIDPKFKSMSKDELILTANTLSDANENLKVSLDELTKKNKTLKEILLNEEKDKKISELKNFVKDMKYTLFSSEDMDTNEKNKELNEFIYDQYLLYGGLEEEEINDLNQIKIKEDNWADNKDFFIFKQKIIERNYQELFKNIAISEELNKLFETKYEENHENNNEDSNIIEKEKITNQINKNNNEDDKKKSDKKENNKNNKTKSGKKKKGKKKEIKKEEEKKFNIDDLNQNQDNKINYRLEDFNLLDDENEKISFKDLSDEKKKKWDDDEDET